MRTRMRRRRRRRRRRRSRRRRRRRIVVLFDVMVSLSCFVTPLSYLPVTFLSPSCHLPATFLPPSFLHYGYPNKDNAVVEQVCGM